MKDLKEYIAINEGLIWSYDPEFVINEVKKKFNLTDNDIKFDTDIDKYNKINYNKNNKCQEKTILIYENRNYENEDMNHYLNTLGWYLSKNDYNDEVNRFYNLYFPKFQHEINNKIHKENKCLYHYTLKSRKDKILKYGLIPKKSNKEKDPKHNYRNRIHLLQDNISKDDIKTIIENDLFDKYDLNDLISIKIDITKLDIDFYIDPNYRKFGIITYDNIHPKYILEINNYVV